MRKTSNILPPSQIHQKIPNLLLSGHPAALFEIEAQYLFSASSKTLPCVEPPLPPSVLATRPRPNHHVLQILFRQEHESFGVGQSLLQSVQLARRRQPHCVAAPLQWKPAQTGVARPIDRPTKRSAPTRKNQEPRKSRIATHATGSGVGSHVVCGSPLVLVFVVVSNIHQRRVFQLPKGGMHVWRRLQVQTRH